MVIKCWYSNMSYKHWGWFNKYFTSYGTILCISSCWSLIFWKRTSINQERKVDPNNWAASVYGPLLNKSPSSLFWIPLTPDVERFDYKCFTDRMQISCGSDSSCKCELEFYAFFAFSFVWQLLPVMVKFDFFISSICIVKVYT